MRRFKAVYNLVKNLKIKILLRAERSPPSSYAIQILASEDQSEGRYSFSNPAHFWPMDTIRDVLALLYQELQKFLQHFLGSKQVAKKTKI